MGTRNEVPATLCCGSALENHGGTADACHRNLRFGGTAECGGAADDRGGTAGRAPPLSPGSKSWHVAAALRVATCHRPAATPPTHAPRPTACRRAWPRPIPSHTPAMPRQRRSSTEDIIAAGDRLCCAAVDHMRARLAYEANAKEVPACALAADPHFVTLVQLQAANGAIRTHPSRSARASSLTRRSRSRWC